MFVVERFCGSCSEGERVLLRTMTMCIWTLLSVLLRTVTYLAVVL